MIPFRLETVFLIFSGISFSGTEPRPLPNAPTSNGGPRLKGGTIPNLETFATIPRFARFETGILSCVDNRIRSERRSKVGGGGGSSESRGRNCCCSIGRTNVCARIFFSSMDLRKGEGKGEGKNLSARICTSFALRIELKVESLF